MTPKLAILDMDGTLFRGQEVIAGAPEAVATLRHNGVIVRYVTNNASQTIGTYAAKLRGMGFEAHDEAVISSSLGAARMLSEEGLKLVFPVGEPGMIETLERGGLSIVGPGEQAEAVVAGICLSLSYALIDRALQHLLEGARFVATNTDATYPLEGGRLAPGAGATVGAIRACAGREPEVVGKPEPYLIEMILRETGVAPSEALVIGDRLETDIEAGRRAGCETLLVLSGVSDVAPLGQPYARDLSAWVSTAFTR